MCGGDKGGYKGGGSGARSRGKSREVERRDQGHPCQNHTQDTKLANSGIRSPRVPMKLFCQNILLQSVAHCAFCSLVV